MWLRSAYSPSAPTQSFNYRHSVGCRCICCACFLVAIGQNPTHRVDSRRLTGDIAHDLPELTATATEVATPIPASTSASQTQSQVIQQSHVVQPGETLLAIANQYQVTVEEIQVANNLSNELIRPDQRLIIPKTIQVPVNSTTGAGTTSGELTYTVVRKIPSRLPGSLAVLQTKSLPPITWQRQDIIRPRQSTAYRFGKRLPRSLMRIRSQTQPRTASVASKSMPPHRASHRHTLPRTSPGPGSMRRFF